jgi:CheY-like chemotaxis protein
VPPRTVLVIDDEPMIRHLLKTLLSQSGFRAVGAGNGQEALDYLRAHAVPSLIVTDLRIPVMDGFQFRQAQLADPGLADVPVIVHPATLDAVDCTPLGNVLFWPKPKNPVGLVRLVTQLCA